MIYIYLNNVSNLNDSLQVGDMIYATPTDIQDGAGDYENDGLPVGSARIVGVLRKIDQQANIATLHADETPFAYPYTPIDGDFIMFSKYSQTDGEINGYYARAKFVNDSKEKAELFAVSSEIIINSK